MNCHQILTGAVNSGENCYSVGSVEGVPFTAYTSGCNIVVLASTFERVQIIPGIVYGNIQVNCIDCSTDVGKIAAAYGKKIIIFEPTPLLHQSSNHKLDYKWIQTASLEADCAINLLSWCLEGTKLLSGGVIIQMWHMVSLPDEHVQIGIGNEQPEIENVKVHWDCVWQCRTATPVCFLQFSPDGSLFVSAGKADRLVKIWFESAAKNSSFSHSFVPNGNVPNVSFPGINLPLNNGAQAAVHEINYSFIYIAHPRAITSISWRKTSKYLSRGSVANMLITSCRDNICRLWVQTLLPEDGLVNFSQLEGLSDNIIPKSLTQRHRQKILQRLKHMKFSQFKRRQHVTTTISENEKENLKENVKENVNLHEPIPNLPSTFSVHDFHTFGIYGNAMIPGLHFHLAGSINAETDIPLVPSLSAGGSLSEDLKSNPTFVIHWLNNKEMTFTQLAEKMLQEVSKNIIQNELNAKNAKQSDVGSDKGEAETDDGASVITSEPEKKPIKPTKKPTKKIKTHGKADHDDSAIPSRQSFYTNSSSASLATEFSCNEINSNQVQFGEMIDRKLDSLIKTWHTNPDLLFSIYPVDGSLLVWLVEWLDETTPGSFRQPKISFSLRIPNAISLGDASTMSHCLALYSPRTYFNLKSTLSNTSTPTHSEAEAKEKTDFSEQEFLSTPTICMLSKHNNGSLNLWTLGFEEGTNYTHLLNINHSSRVCGHRFRVNDIKCHPVLPLLLTTSHHNLPGTNLSHVKSPGSSGFSTSPASTPNSCCPPFHGLTNTGFCSELILWKVNPVGPSSKSDGVTELARINSLKTAAFANVAWIPTLLPSTTLGSLSNSPSACFVASDGHQLRVYQAVLDARSLLSHVPVAERKTDLNWSASDLTVSSEIEHSNLKEALKIISLQSTAKPGCIIELNSITDAVHDWQNTQLLHVFQDQLIHGDNELAYQLWNEKQTRNTNGLVEASLGAVVDLRHSEIFEEPFYLIVVEKNEYGQSVLHMWRLLISSHCDDAKMSKVPDGINVQDISDHSNISSPTNSSDLHGDKSHDKSSEHSSKASSLKITTHKVCTQILPLPNDVEVIHASPAAGHLSSSNIYPACFAPYLIITACSDRKVRFWRCKPISEDETDTNYYKDYYYKKNSFIWFEWEMMLSKNASSSIEVPGMPLYVSCAYSGRIACACKSGQSFSRVTSSTPDKRFININLVIYECESTGGSEWVLEDTITLKNIALPQTEVNLGIELGPLVDTKLRNKKTVDTLVMRLASKNEEQTTDNKTNNIQRLLSVPSYTTMESLKRIISEQGNQFTLTQKSLVQLDWVSTEDGSHVLTVSAGSKIFVFAQVSTDVAQLNLLAMKASEKTPTTSKRMLLKQASSMAPVTTATDIRWMNLRTTDLITADGLPPLPMQLSWVRDGILVVGMDNEMHIYTQWKSNKSHVTSDSVEIADTRILTEQWLLCHAQESSQLRLPTDSTKTQTGPVESKTQTGPVESNVVDDDDDKLLDGPTEVPQKDKAADKALALSHLPDIGLFEISRLACPVLPQYHPKQLMELLSFSKIYRVRAILGHLVSCLCKMDSLKDPQEFQQDFEPKSDSEKSPRSWVRTRTLSIAAHSTSPNQQSLLEDLPFIAEEVELDYTEISSIRPMTLYTLLEADNEKPIAEKSSKGQLENDFGYDNLFDTSVKTQVEETLDELFDRNVFSFNKPKEDQDESNLNFGPRQAKLLTKLLTHSQLPGLSSLDQMHLLALADSVASFNPNSKSTTKLTDENSNGLALDDQIISADSLDDCGLRFLLSMRQHIYLLRCLPLVQRKTLQKQGLGSHDLIWAFHSETQEELMQLIPSIQRGNPNWQELRELGVGWWIRNNAILRKLIEKLAKAAFKVNNDPLDSALYYLAMKKKSLIWGLFRSVHDRRMTEFFQNNFADEKWRKAALKNAYALLGKQRFEHSAAFFLLAGSVWDAVEVCLTKLNDLQLAMVIVRLYEGDIETVSENLKRLLYTEILGCKIDGSDYNSNKAHPDPFLRSMAYWMLQDYNNSLTTLLEIDIGNLHPKYTNENTDINVNPSVFNFYLYLRTQPLIVRRQFAQNLQEANLQTKAKDKLYDISYGGDAITPYERRLFFLTAHSHFRSGCPSLALEVLSRLPNRIVMDDQKLLNKSFEKSKSIDNSQEKEVKKQVDTGFDWGAPVSLGTEETPDFKILTDSGSDDESDNGLEMKLESKEDKSDTNKGIKLDIMGQQLKFIACLKIIMEELSSLASGLNVDGNQLRIRLYEWLEKSVEALKKICNYRTFSMRHLIQSSGEHISDPNCSNETKKMWLTANEALLRTLLSYCSLHAALGDGLYPVREELTLLLQESDQEQLKHSNLSAILQSQISTTQNIFTDKPPTGQDDWNASEDGSTGDGDLSNPESITIFHKDQDNISAFCMNQLNSGVFALSTSKEILEFDFSNFLSSTHNLHLLKTRKVENVRRMCAHQTLPLYLSGSQDGAVNLWEWNHQQPIASPRPAGTFAKVTRVRFNQQGNKFGVTDGDGNLSLWQVAMTSGTKPFFNMQCHSKQVSDFTFLGASSLVVTAGQSSDHKNVVLWDTLLPAKKRMVTSFSCHEQHGASSLLFAPMNQLLITGGRKGDVYIFDMRQRIQRNKFVAHENSAIKCMALDPAEEFFVTGSADGDIKVWGLGSVNPFYSFPGEHSRNTLFRNIGMGVSNLYIDQQGHLFSCGADGSMKMRILPDKGSNIVNAL